MSVVQEYHGVIGQPTPILTYRNAQVALHWDGIFFAVLCLASWVLFAYLWARMHWLNYLERQKPPPLSRQTVEDWISSKHWRN
jgi:hypothetical protein